jgi:hypothetical protein
MARECANAIALDYLICCDGAGGDGLALGVAAVSKFRSKRTAALLLFAVNMGDEDAASMERDEWQKTRTERTAGNPFGRGWPQRA